MKTFLYRLYYCIFIGLKRSMRGNDGAIAFMSALMLSYLLFLNLFAILLLLKSVMHIQKPLFCLLLIVFPISSSVYFLKGKKYLQIKAMFDNEEKKVRTKRKTACIIYMIFSFVIVMVIPYLTC
jgi:hypothetical protein